MRTLSHRLFGSARLIALLLRLSGMQQPGCLAATRPSTADSECDFARHYIPQRRSWPCIPAIDVPRRAFSVKRLQQSRHYNSIFGPSGSRTRRDNDPFLLVRTANPESTPYFFLTCGEQEGLLPANREFAALLRAHQFRFEFHTVRGTHDWSQWNAWLPSLFPSLAEHMGSQPSASQQRP
jgi:acetyl esterase/lipase